MDYSLPRSKTKAEKVMNRIQKQHFKKSVQKIHTKHQEKAIKKYTK